MKSCNSDNKKTNPIKPNFIRFLAILLFLISSSITIAQTSPKGDFNNDSTVDLHDLAIFSQQWLDPINCPENTKCPDFRSFAKLAQNWQKTWPRLLISEFCASNQGHIKDGHGDDPDWIEIYNPTNDNISLDGWFLTDNDKNLNKWAFPDGITILPGEYYLLFASKKDKSTFPENYPYVDPQGHLHTNFNLQSSSGFLGLVRPDRTISSKYSPTYPSQYEDISYGIGGLSDVITTEQTLIDEFGPATAIVPQDGSMGLDWTEVDFDDSLWKSGSTGVGFDNQTTYGALLGLDVGEMHKTNGSAYIRVEFDVNDPSIYDTLLLQMKYDDGFIAYLNGLEIKSANPPADPNWNSISKGGHPDVQAVEFVDFGITEFKDALQVGTNVLGIHGMNNGASSSDLLMLPKLTAVYTISAPESSITEGYFLTPTPGKGNGAITTNVGPRISDVTKNPSASDESEDIPITATVTATEEAIDSVTLHYRINFGAVVSVAMNNDSGSTYAASIPSTSFSTGDMVRWYVSSDDTEGRSSRYPLFPDPLTSDEYLGTMINDPAVVTQMPVLYWFLEPGTESAANTRTGTHTSLFYNGEFHDNVFVRIRGGSIAGLNKKSYKFEFNTSNHFRFDERFGRVDEFNLNTTYTDKAYVRQPLSFETFDRAGLPGPESFLVRVQRNGEFFSVAAFIEQPDSDMLKREKLDDEGALYKMYNGVTSSGGQKKTRRWENNSDLGDLVNGINDLSGQSRTNFIFDNLDIPAVLNFLATSVLLQHNDDSKKNYYLYRDTNGSGEWMYLPWDLDLTFGKHYMSRDSILTDIIWATEDYILGGSGMNVPIWPSHPFVDTQATPGNRSWNHMTDALLNTPEFVEMYRRRLRTLMDELLQSPGTEANLLHYETRIAEMTAQIASDVELDRAKWGWYGTEQPLTDATNILINEYLVLCRTHLFVTHNADNVASYDKANSFSAQIPNEQPSTFAVNIGDIEFNPASTNQDEEYIELTNPNSFAVDISGWKLTGGVEFTFKPGTIIRAGNNMYVSPNVKSFRARQTTPTGNQGHFVQGNYKGHLSNWPETINLLDKSETIVSSLTYSGNPSDAQRYLRVTEIMYHPSPGGDYNEEEYEFVELKNIGDSPLLLDNVKFTEGIAFVFADGGNVSLGAGEYIFLVRNRTAFESRFGTGYNIADEYKGFCDNGGETIKLEDATNSTILEFTFDDGWYDITDGKGFSLTFRNPLATDLSTWNKKGSWRPSTSTNGSPGYDDTGDIPPAGAIVINEVLAHSDTDPNDWIEIYNTTDVPINIGGWFLSDNNNSEVNGKKYEIANGTIIDAKDYIVFYEGTHFANDSVPGCHIPFALSENGDTVYLQSGSGGEFTGYYKEEDFGASEADVAFGRYQKSTGTFNFIAMSENTPAQSNAYPKVGPVVITEIMYHPETNPDAEYVELLNISDSTVTLYDAQTQTPWKFEDEGGIEFSFPTEPSVAIEPGERILLIKDLTALTAEFGTISGVQIFDWGEGSLGNSGERIQLSKGGDIDEFAVRQFIRINRIVFGDQAPWPTSADGKGDSLDRITNTEYGNDPSNWQGANPTPGQ